MDRNPPGRNPRNRPFLIAASACCLFLLLATACPDRDLCGIRRTPEAWPVGGYYALFEAAGEYFYVWIRSVEGIARIEEWLAGNPQAEPPGIPGGPIELDPTFNPGYSYRLQPDSVSFGEMWIEVCDARPCYVEEDPEGWYANPNTWCPWAARVQVLWDCSNGTGSSCGAPVFVAGPE